MSGRSRSSAARRRRPRRRHDGVDAAPAPRSTAARSACADERAVRALEPAHRGVGVQAHDQAVAERARRLAACDVPGVQQVEAAAGGDDGAAARRAYARGERDRRRPASRAGAARRRRRDRGRAAGRDERATPRHGGGTASAGAAPSASARGGAAAKRSPAPQGSPRRRARRRHGERRARRRRRAARRARRSVTRDGAGPPARARAPGRGARERPGRRRRRCPARARGLGGVRRHQRARPAPAPGRAGAGPRRPGRVATPAQRVAHRGRRRPRRGRSRRPARAAAPADRAARASASSGRRAPAPPPRSSRTQRPPAGADADLLGRRARAGRGRRPRTPRVGSSAAQLARPRVVAERGDERDLAPVARGEQRRPAPAPPGAGALAPLVDAPAPGASGRAARRVPVEVAVEQGVADDDRAGAHAATSAPRAPALRRVAPLERLASTARAEQVHATRCTSWTVAVCGASTHSASSAASASGFGAGPVSAHVVRPQLGARRSTARDHVRAAPGGRLSATQHVARPAVRAHLPGEHLLGAVVVADRGEARASRRAGAIALSGCRSVAIAADQLGRQVLGLRRRCRRCRRPAAGRRPSRHVGEARGPSARAVGAASSSARERVPRARRGGAAPVPARRCAARLMPAVRRASAARAAARRRRRASRRATRSQP